MTTHREAMFRRMWVLILGGFLIWFLADGIMEENIEVCESYWGESCERYDIMHQQCHCESGIMNTTKEMIDNYNQLIQKLNQEAKDDYWKNKTKAWNEINLTEVVAR